MVLEREAVIDSIVKKGNTQELAEQYISDLEEIEELHRVIFEKDRDISRLERENYMLTNLIESIYRRKD